MPVIPATTLRPGPGTGELQRLPVRKRARTKMAIESAALDLFAEHGYEETTVEQIAARAEVSKATFFRYFGSKGDVIFGAPDDRNRNLVGAIVARPASEDPMTAVRRALRESWLPTVDLDRTVRQTRAARSSPLLRGLSFDLAMRWQADVSGAIATRLELDAPDRVCRLVAGAAFAVLSNAVNLWVDAGGQIELVSAADDGFELLHGLFAGASQRARGAKR